MLCRRAMIIACLLANALVSSVHLWSQEVDATIDVRYVEDTRDDRITFDVVLTRRSATWSHWANATLRIDATELRQTGGLIPGLHAIELLPGTSDLPLVPYMPGSMQGYACGAAIVQGRLRIAVIGPDSVGQAVMLNEANPAIRLGRFVLATTDGSPLSTELAMAEPHHLMQSNASKLLQDSTTTASGDDVMWYRRHDNVELRTRYSVVHSTTPDCDTTSIAAFGGRYQGDRVVELAFTSECEQYLEGFIIERALVDRRQPERLDFTARANLDYGSNDELTACSDCPNGWTRTGLRDAVDYRRERYAYRLLGIHAETGERVIYDTTIVQIPGAIIRNAAVLRNPFRQRVDITFDVDDRMRIDAVVYDVRGGRLGALVDASGQPMVNYVVPPGQNLRGSYEFGEVSSQGLINIVLVGYPLDERSIDEVSRIVLKAQHLR